MLRGNAVADLLADIAAQEARVPAEDRARVQAAEVMASQVHWRLLRAALDAAAADGRRQRRAATKARQAAPAPRICAMFASAHQLAEDGRSCRACRCSSSDEAMTAWLQAPCHGLRRSTELLSELGGPAGAQVQIGGQRVDASHRLRWRRQLDCWFCERCGFFGVPGGRQLGEGLRQPCPPGGPTKTGREYLDRVRRGLWPKAGQRAAGRPQKLAGAAAVGSSWSSKTPP